MLSFLDKDFNKTTLDKSNKLEFSILFPDHFFLKLDKKKKILKN